MSVVQSVMGWRGLVVTAVPVPFQPIYCKNLEDSFKLSKFKVNIGAILTLESYDIDTIAACLKNKKKHLLELSYGKKQCNYEFKLIFKELR